MFFAAAKYGAGPTSRFMAITVLVTTFLWWLLTPKEFVALLQQGNVFITLLLVLFGFTFCYWQMIRTKISRQTARYIMPAVFALAGMSIITKYIALGGSSVWQSIAYYLSVATSLIYMRGDGTVYEHVGSYSVLLEKLKGIPLKTDNRKQNTKEEPKIREKNKTLKLSYKEQYMLENLPKEIEKLGEENKAIEVALGNANLYTDDQQKFDELTSKLAANKENLEKMENQWLEVQMKADELENS